METLKPFFSVLRHIDKVPMISNHTSPLRLVLFTQRHQTGTTKQSRRMGLPRNQADISIDQELGKGLSVIQIIALILWQIHTSNGSQEKQEPKVVSWQWFWCFLSTGGVQMADMQNLIQDMSNSRFMNTWECIFVWSNSKHANLCAPNYPRTYLQEMFSSFLSKSWECKSPCKAVGLWNTWGYRESQMQGMIVNNVDGDAREGWLQSFKIRAT